MISRHDGTWLPAPVWPAMRMQNYVYFAGGKAEQRLGKQGRIAVRLHGEDGAGAVETTWTDLDDREVMRMEARYPAQGTLVAGCDLQATGRADCVADIAAGRLSITRSGAGEPTTSGTEFDPRYPFDWRVIWGFRMIAIPWSANLGGPLTLGYVDPSSRGPFADGCLVATVRTEDGAETVETPRGRRNIACWRIETSGPQGREAAAIGKAGEGLVRFDMNLADSALLIAVAG